MGTTITLGTLKATQTSLFLSSRSRELSVYVIGTPGTGKSTLLELFQQSERCLYHLPRLKQKFVDELELILENGNKKAGVHHSGFC